MTYKVSLLLLLLSCSLCSLRGMERTEQHIQILPFYAYPTYSYPISSEEYIAPFADAIITEVKRLKDYHQADPCLLAQIIKNKMNTPSYESMIWTTFFEKGVNYLEPLTCLYSDPLQDLLFMSYLNTRGMQDMCLTKMRCEIGYPEVISECINECAADETKVQAAFYIIHFLRSTYKAKGFRRIRKILKHKPLLPFAKMALLAQWFNSKTVEQRPLSDWFGEIREFRADALKLYEALSKTYTDRTLIEHYYIRVMALKINTLTSKQGQWKHLFYQSNRIIYFLASLFSPHAPAALVLYLHNVYEQVYAAHRLNSHPEERIQLFPLLFPYVNYYDDDEEFEENIRKIKNVLQCISQFDDLNPSFFVDAAAFYAARCKKRRMLSFLMNEYKEYPISWHSTRKLLVLYANLLFNIDDTPNEERRAHLEKQYDESFLKMTQKIIEQSENVFTHEIQKQEGIKYKMVAEYIKKEHFHEPLIY